MKFVSFFVPLRHCPTKSYYIKETC